MCPPNNQYSGTLINDLMDLAAKQKRCDELDAIYAKLLFEMIQKEQEDVRNAN